MTLTGATPLMVRCSSHCCPITRCLPPAISSWSELAGQRRIVPWAGLRSERYLGSPFHPHEVRAGVEAVERFIVMRDDLLEGQAAPVRCRMAVADQGHVIAERNRAAY